MAEHSDRLLEAALVSAVTAALAAASPPVPVFMLRATRGATITAPYVFIQPLGGSSDGSLRDQSDHVARYQITYVGQGSEQSAGLADTVRAALVMTFLTVAGRSCGPVLLDFAPPDLVDEDSDVPLYLKRDQYAIPTFA